MGLGNTTVLSEHIDNPEYFRFLTRSFMTPEHILGERSWHQWRDQFRRELEEFSFAEPSEIDNILPNTAAPTTAEQSANIFLALASRILSVQGNEGQDQERIRVVRILTLCYDNAEIKKRLLGDLNVVQVSLFLHTDKCSDMHEICLEAFRLWKLVRDLPR